MDDLKPCPFCSSHNILMDQHGQVQCDSCLSMGPHPTFTRAKWNTRVPDIAREDAAFEAGRMGGEKYSGGIYVDYEFKYNTPQEWRKERDKK